MVMRLARVTSGALHHHFPTKKDLGLAVIRERVALAIEQTWLQPVQRAKSARAGILTVFDRTATALEQRGSVQGCPLNNLALELSTADEDIQAALHALFQYWQEGLRERIAVDQATGYLPGRDADALASFVIAAYSGSMAMAKVSQCAAPLRTCATQIEAMLATG